MRVIIKGLMFLVVIASSVLQASAANKFFDGDEKYRGFYWFEQKPDKKKVQKQSDLTFKSMSSKKAAENIKERKEQLVKARNIMLELSFRGAEREEIFKAVRHYKQLENEMRDSGLELALAWESVNFTNPELVDRISNPVNVPANKLKRLEEKNKNAQQIKAFAGDYDLVLFEKDGCPYCTQFKPILEYFTSNYGFNLDVVGDRSEHQKLIQDLNIQAAPTLIAVSRDGEVAFELSRGLSTLSELEDSVMQAVFLIESGYQFGFKG